MFDDYAKKLQSLGENVPAIFKMVANRGKNHFRNQAIEYTDKEKLVDTGNYRRNWNAEVVEIGSGEYGIVCMNSVEYASFLEDGYEIRQKHFVPFDKMQGTPKTNNMIASFKDKYPNAKGFIAKPRRFTGKKVGRRAIQETEGFVLLELEKEIEIAMKSKELGTPKSELRKYAR